MEQMKENQRENTDRSQQREIRMGGGRPEREQRMGLNYRNRATCGGSSSPKRERKGAKSKSSGHNKENKQCHRRNRNRYRREQAPGPESAITAVKRPHTTRALPLLPPSRSPLSDSVRPHGRQPTRLLRPRDSPGKHTGVGCHFLLQCMKVKTESEVAQSCPPLSDPMDCSLPGSSAHGIFQARVPEWGAIAFSQ